MTLAELKERIDWLALQSNLKLEDIEVCIPNNKEGMWGGTPTTAVKAASKGIDWDNRKFIIFPEVDMVEQQKPTT